MHFYNGKILVKTMCNRFAGFILSMLKDISSWSWWKTINIRLVSVITRFFVAKAFLESKAPIWLDGFMQFLGVRIHWFLSG